MANSISELEAERAKILDEIENRAKSMSTNAENTSLQDWLNAAEDVVPQSALEAEQQLQKAKRRLVEAEQQNRSSSDGIPFNGRNPSNQPPADLYRQATQPSSESHSLAFSDDDFADDFNQVNLSSNLNNHSTTTMEAESVNNNRLQQPESSSEFSTKYGAPNSSAPIGSCVKGPVFAGVAIMLSLFVTILVVVVLGYNSMHEELAVMQAQNQENQQTIAELQQKIEDMPLNAEATLASTDQNQKKITSLQSQLVVLEAQLSTVRNDLKNVQQTNATQGIDSTELLQQKIEQIVSSIQRADIPSQDLEPVKPEIKPFKAAVNIAIEPDGGKIQNQQENTVDIIEPQEPQSPQVIEPMEAGKKTVAKPIEPVVATPVKVAMPEKNYTPDVKWLMEQPKENYTLQLASMLEPNSIKKMIKDKGLKEGRLIPQVRDGKSMYVLVVGSFSERKAANQLAAQLKKEHGIAPWIRTTKAVLGRVE